MGSDRRLDWLRTRGVELGGGYDASGWAESVWVLHTVWEASGVEPEPDVEFGGVTFSPAGELGWVEPDSPEWPTVRWSELYGRSGREWPGRHDAPPAFEWLSGVCNDGHVGPAEGSMDSVTLPRLVSHLASVSTMVTAYWGGGATQWSGETILEGDLPGLELRGVPSKGTDFTPSNMWPQDRTWLTYTDYDLQATKVSGSHEFVQAIRNDHGLETVEWPPRK